MTTLKDKSHNDNDANATAFAGRQLSESELESIAGGKKGEDPPPSDPGKKKP